MIHIGECDKTHFGLSWLIYNEYELVNTDKAIMYCIEIYFSVSIDKDSDKKVFLIDFTIRMSDILEQTLLTDFEIPIPVCNDNFTLEGIIADIFHL